ncbi:hypothetical protein PO909_033296 [Leuciscus waleckii]
MKSAIKFLPDCCHQIAAGSQCKTYQPKLLFRMYDKTLDSQPEYRFSTCPPFRIVQTFPPYTYFPSGKQVVCGGVYGESLTDSWREETQTAADEWKKKKGARERRQTALIPSGLSTPIPQPTMLLTKQTEEKLLQSQDIRVFHRTP